MTTTFKLTELANELTGAYRLDTSQTSSSPAGLPVVAVQGGHARAVSAPDGQSVLWAKRLGHGGVPVTATDGIKVVADPAPVVEADPGTQGTGTSVARGDYARWYREGAFDDATGSWDFTADLASSHGSTIVNDTSAGWLTGWGNQLPKVTEAGVYLIAASIVPAADERAEVAVGGLYGPDPDFTAVGPTVAHVVIRSPAPGEPAAVSVTMYLPANTHIGINTSAALVAGTEDPLQSVLVIQRVA